MNLEGPDFAPETPAAPEQDPNELIPIVNREARLHQLAYHLPDKQEVDGNGRQIVNVLTTEVIKLAPGLTFVRYGDVVKTGFLDPETQDLYQGKLAVVDPLTMQKYEVESLAKITASRQALRQWREMDTRDFARAAIDARLASNKTTETVQ